FVHGPSHERIRSSLDLLSPGLRSTRVHGVREAEELDRYKSPLLTGRVFANRCVIILRLNRLEVEFVLPQLFGWWLCQLYPFTHLAPTLGFSRPSPISSPCPQRPD